MVNSNLTKLMQHVFASEVIEYIYCESSDQEKREMIFGLYGNFALVLKEILHEKKNLSLKEFAELKP